MLGAHSGQPKAFSFTETRESATLKPSWLVRHWPLGVRGSALAESACLMRCSLSFRWECSAQTVRSAAVWHMSWGLTQLPSWNLYSTCSRCCLAVFWGSLRAFAPAGGGGALLASGLRCALGFTFWVFLALVGHHNNKTKVSIVQV